MRRGVRAGSLTEMEDGGGSSKGTIPSPDTRIATAPAPGGIGKTRPRPRLAGAPFGQLQPSDPHRSILPRGRAGWSVQGDQKRTALGYLAFRTGLNNASVLSRLIAHGGSAHRLRSFRRASTWGCRNRWRGERARGIHSRVRGVLALGHLSDARDARARYRQATSPGAFTRGGTMDTDSRFLETYARTHRGVARTGERDGCRSI
jgi:hypothetical protein